jgi:uncharacterized protein YndB with AHSA1/START domain
MELKFTVQTKINKPIEEIFDAIVNPNKITGYFCNKSDGPLVEGQTVNWSWSSKPIDHTADVKVKQIIPNSKIIIEWPSQIKGERTTAEMSFSTTEDGRTMISITETGWPSTEAGLKASYGNCQGWQHMITCLRGYIMYGIDLRK